jgi:hypothetical protein
MSKFYFAGDSASVSSSDDEDNLPYPQALPRTDFLVPNFDPSAYLSTLSDRHQTLEDLRSDLRERSQALSKELLDLVNTNYEQFLSLGSDLRGGEEKVEDVRVGLLGFKRGVEDVRTKIKERGIQVQGLLDEKTNIGKQISTGRKLLEIDARLEELEEKLMMASAGRNAIGSSEDAWSESDDDNDEEGLVEETGATGTSLKKLRQLVQDYRHTDQVIASVGSHHPFIIAQEPRLMRIRNTLLLDLSTALKQARGAGGSSSSRLLGLMGIYREMGEATEAVKVLKTLKS